MRKTRLDGRKRPVLLAWMLALVLVAATALLAGCGGSGEKQGGTEKPVELKLAHFFPATHPVEKELIKPWAAEIEEATQGRVKITSYPGNTLLPAEEVYDGVVTGIADIGLSCFSYTRGKFPLLEVFELPGVTYNNSKVATKVAWEGIKQLNPAEIQDTRLLMVTTTGPGDLFTKTPVRSLSDLRGMEIRATGLSAKTLAALGATPVAQPQSEAYESLAKGVVKGNLSPVEVLQGWKHAEVTNYLTLTPFLYNTLFFVTMNLDQWNALSPDLQEVIREISDKYMEEVAPGLWDKQNEAALQYAVEETGMEVINLPQAEAERWIELVQPIQDEFVTAVAARGLDGQGALDLVKQLADQYNEVYK